MTVLPSSAAICIIGFGKTGGTLGAGLAKRGHVVRAWDILLDNPVARDAMRARIEDALVDPAGSLHDAMRGAKLVISAPSAISAAEVASQATALLVPGQLFVDLHQPTASTMLEALGLESAIDYDQTARRGELP